MKKAYLISIISGMVLSLSFQNCSKLNGVNVSDLSSSQLSAITHLENGTQLDESQTSNFASLAIDQRTICPMVMCVAPPANCHYESENLINNDKYSGTQSAVCQTGCGKLVCTEGATKPHQCAAMTCQEPGVGCRYANESVKRDENGCDLNCGLIVCDQKTAVEPVPPQLIS